jgi:hypothetical protein
VAAEFTHAEAVEEACRRLAVMAVKWPDTPWRMRVRKTRSRVNRRWHVWTVYAIVPHRS